MTNKALNTNQPESDVKPGEFTVKHWIRSWGTTLILALLFYSSHYMDSQNAYRSVDSVPVDQALLEAEIKTQEEKRLDYYRDKTKWSKSMVRLYIFRPRLILGIIAVQTISTKTMSHFCLLKTKKR